MCSRPASIRDLFRCCLTLGGLYAPWHGVCGRFSCSPPKVYYICYIYIYIFFFFIIHYHYIVLRTPPNTLGRGAPAALRPPWRPSAVPPPVVLPVSNIFLSRLRNIIKRPQPQQLFSPTACSSPTMQTWLAETTETASHTTLKAKGGRFTTPAGPPPSHVPAAMCYVCVYCICIGYSIGEMIAHTLLCYLLYSRECWEHEWPLGSAGTDDLVRCGPVWLLGLRREYFAAFGRASRANHRGAAPHAAALSSAADSARLQAVVHTWNRSRSYRTRRGIRVRARARGGGGRARPSWAPCDGAGGRRRGRRAFAAAPPALPVHPSPPPHPPWYLPPPPRYLTFRAEK